MPRALRTFLAALAVGLAACGTPSEQDANLLATKPTQPPSSPGGQSPGATDAAPPAAPGGSQPTGSPASPAPPLPTQPRIAILSEGTIVNVTLSSSLNSGTASVGDRFEAEVNQTVSVDGKAAIPMGSRIRGFVEDVHKAKRGAGHGSLALSFDALVLPDGEEVEIQAGLSQETDGKKKRNAAIIGGSAAGGAILGRVVGDDTKDAAIGAVVGGAIATGVVLAKKGSQVELPAGTLLELVLETSTAVPVPPDLS